MDRLLYGYTAYAVRVGDFLRHVEIRTALELAKTGRCPRGGPHQRRRARRVARIHDWARQRLDEHLDAYLIREGIR